MTYSTLSCPKCKAIIATGAGSNVDIGKPYITCPYCKTLLKCEDCRKEWAMRKHGDRKRFLLFVPILCGVIFGLIAGGLFAIIDIPVGAIFFIMIACFFPAFLLMRFVWLERWRNKIKESIVRTENAEYRKFLEELGYKIYTVSDKEILKLTGCQKSELKNKVDEESKEKQNKEEKLKEKVEYTLQNIYGYGCFGKSDVIDINKLVYTFNTNKEFLNEIFNMGLAVPLHTSRYELNEEIEIWIVKFDNTKRGNYRNYFTDNEEFVNEIMYRPENRKKYAKRIVVEKHSLQTNVYEIKGIYERDEDLSNEYKNVYKRTEEDVTRFMNMKSWHIRGFNI